MTMSSFPIAAADETPPYRSRRRKRPLISSVLPKISSSSHANTNGIAAHPFGLGTTNGRTHEIPKEYIRDTTEDASAEGEEDDEYDDWGEQQQHDPVGDCVTRMLNEGKVAHFGFRRMVPSEQQTDLQEIFSWSPLLSARNYRAVHRMVRDFFQDLLRRLSNLDSAANNAQGVAKESLNKQPGINRESMWFMLETFLALYTTIYSLNDIFLRWSLESIAFLFLGILSTIVDVAEVKHASLFLFHLCPLSFQTITLQCILIIRQIYQSVESRILWGKRFQGRSLLWSEEGRILKFRLKHIRVMKINNERRLNRRQRRKTRLERRKKERKGLSFDSCDFAKMEAELAVKEALDAAADELKRKPPTYFPNRLNAPKDAAATSIRSDATNKHFDSLEYCHHMIFRSQTGHLDMKTVSITTSRMGSSGTNTLSPREAIEVTDNFPDIKVSLIADHDNLSHAESVSSVASEYSLPYKYDFVSEDDDDHSSDDDEGNIYEDSEDEDELSEVSYTSEEKVKKMDWISVGAKIGSKILKSRQVHRVISNPNKVGSFLPEEAKKLIDGMKHDHAEERFGSPSKSSTWESQQSSKTKELDIVSSDESKSTDALIPKPPVHVMWTSAGSAATSSSSYGAVTLPVSTSPTPQNRGPKVFVSSAQESVELMRESSDGQRLDTINDDLNGPISPARNINSPYNLRISLSMPVRGSLTPKNDTPKHSNQASDFTPPRSLFPISRSDSTTRLAPMEKGVKIVVPMFAPNASNGCNKPCFYQMGTVVSSSRIFVTSDEVSRKDQKWSLLGGNKEETNCLAIKLVLDRAILRGCKFAEMSIRIMDEWNWIPRFSKYPIGSCVATTFGIGVLVGWRVEDDMHIIRSLWNRSGPGTGLAYLRRDCLHSVVEAAVGFDVETRLGLGRVAAYIRGGSKNTDGKYFVHLKSRGRYQGRVVEFKRNQIISCRVAKFIPVTEHIRAAALYQLEILHYKAKVREHMLNDPSSRRQKGTWRKFSEYVDLFAASLSKAIAEDPDFDREVDKFISHIINVLDDTKDAEDISLTSDSISDGGNSSIQSNQLRVIAAHEQSQHWNIQDAFASFFAGNHKKPVKIEPDSELVLSQVKKFHEAHHSLSVILRVLLRTVAVAKASVPDRPKLHIALAMIHEALLFVRQVIRVQNKNVSKALIEAWLRTINEISITFGPLKERTAALGKKMAKKLKKHSDIAKKRVLSFVDIVLGDTALLHSLERGDWKLSLSRLEYALVTSKITDQATCEQLHRGFVLLHKNLAPRKRDRLSKAAARRTQIKALRFAKFMKIVASPGRSFLRLLAADDVLELFDRVLLRVFDNDPECSMMINIHAFNFRSLRHLRTLNNMSIAGKLWETVLDAIDEELTFVTSELPDQTKYFIDPFIKLFSLGVAKFHSIQSGDSNADWLDFLMEEDAVKIIQDLDMKIIDCLDSFCKDVKQLFEVMPYIKTIDNDILNLMDELDFDLMFKEITVSIGDSDKFTSYITERSAILVERFLDYLPRMSIPIEKRELQDGWVLTCRGSDGGDLRLSDINVKRENLLCQVLGSENVFRPLGKDDYIGSPKNIFPDPSFESDTADDANEKDGCVLEEVREMILSAQNHGCWNPGLGGLKQPFFYSGTPPQLQDLPLSEPLKTGIDLWQSCAISDFEFTQIAIREVSRQIHLQGRVEENTPSIRRSSKNASPASSPRKPFNPQIDSTVLLLDIKNLTLHLNEFIFRVEKGENKTIFDPVFEGAGSLTVKNVCISLRVEAKKERVIKNGSRTERPLLQLASFDVRLEKLMILFKETGADWILNTVLKGFRDQITRVVEDNVRDQIKKQVLIALEHVNGLFDANADLLLKILGTNLDDLEERVP